MSLEKELQQRSGNKCELCTAKENLGIYLVPPSFNKTSYDCILICSTCLEQLTNPEKVNPNHWRCLNDSMWSDVDAVKVVSWRMLSRLKAEGWSQNLLDMMYLEDDVKKWAEATGEGIEIDPSQIHKDCNGVELKTGDTVVLIKDLNVKGAGFTAKRGTAVRGITLVSDNPAHIEGKVEGQLIVILTEFVRKSN